MSKVKAAEFLRAFLGEKCGGFNCKWTREVMREHGFTIMRRESPLREGWDERCVAKRRLKAYYFISQTGAKSAVRWYNIDIGFSTRTLALH